MPRFKSSRRPTALKDTDYDHEIRLIDHTTSSSSPSPERTRTRSFSASVGTQPKRDSLAPNEQEVDLRRHSHESNLHRKGTRNTLREELAKKKYGKYSTVEDQQPAAEPAPVAGPATSKVGADASDIDGPRPKSSGSQKKSSFKGKADRESVIDILYENERGGFLCGLPLFSSAALGAADAPPWTNVAQKASATNTTNAQVPDPTWEWAWKDWTINHDVDSHFDADGWEYSFMYAKWCSWHGPRWWNSFVRRRAWIRKRVKKNQHQKRISEAHRLNSDYFTIHPSMSRSRSPSRAPSMVESRLSRNTRDMEPAAEKEDICDIGALMKALKESRIDREKTEAVENFIIHGGDDLVYLSEKMHDIMAQFIFQASRRSLLSHLTALFEESSSQSQKEEEKATKDDDKLPDGLVEVEIEGKPDRENQDQEAAKRRLKNIENAYHAADKAVKTLEYWSDIKNLAQQGDTKGAVDEDQGWDAERWAGVDNSGPKDVISDPVVGRDDDLDAVNREDGDGEDRRVSFADGENVAKDGEIVDKGKGKERA